MLDAEEPVSPGAPSIAAEAASRLTPRISISTCCRCWTTISRRAAATGRARAADAATHARRCSTGGSGCFDYTRVREDVERDCDRRLWLLFDEAEEKHPAHPAYLLRHMGADARHWPLDPHYFQDQSAPVYAVTCDDLEDDRWVVRAWHADEWIQRLLRYFCAKDIRTARPDLWASDDPSAVVPGTGPDGQPNPPATPTSRSSSWTAASRTTRRGATRI